MNRVYTICILFLYNVLYNQLEPIWFFITMDFNPWRRSVCNNLIIAQQFRGGDYSIVALWSKRTICVFIWSILCKTEVMIDRDCLWLKPQAHEERNQLKQVNTKYHWVPDRPRLCLMGLEWIGNYSDPLEEPGLTNFAPHDSLIISSVGSTIEADCWLLNCFWSIKICMA